MDRLYGNEISSLRFDLRVGGYTRLESCYLIYEKKEFIKVVILLFERRVGN